MATLHLLSAGAAYGLISGLAKRFEAEHACILHGTYGAVGAMREKLLAGAACEVLLLSRKLIDALVAERRLEASTVADVGVVQTGSAVIAGEAVPDLSTAEALREAVLRAPGIYLPDMGRATAGIHMKSVLERLGVFDQVRDKLHEYPNGATAMRTMAEQRIAGSLGFTQLSEIIYTAGVEPAAALPSDFSLDTVYSVAVASGSGSRDAALAFVQMLCDPSLDEHRRRAGFRPVGR